MGVLHFTQIDKLMDCNGRAYRVHYSPFTSILQTVIRTFTLSYTAPTNRPMIAFTGSTAVVCAMLGPATHTVL